VPSFVRKETISTDRNGGGRSNREAVGVVSARRPGGNWAVQNRGIAHWLTPRKTACPSWKVAEKRHRPSRNPPKNGIALPESAQKAASISPKWAAAPEPAHSRECRNSMPGCWMCVQAHLRRGSGTRIWRPNPAPEMPIGHPSAPPELGNALSLSPCCPPPPEHSCRLPMERRRACTLEIGRASSHQESHKTCTSAQKPELLKWRHRD
jgi:hypothetical protein